MGQDKLDSTLRPGVLLCPLSMNEIIAPLYYLEYQKFTIYA